MTQDEINLICDKLSEGNSLRSICRKNGWAESSVRRWIVQDETAMAQTARARELGCDAMADECVEISDNAELEPADRRVRIETRIKLIGKWSQRYSDKLTVTNNTTVTHKHDLDSLSTGELEQLEGILAKSERRSGDTGEAVAPSVH